MINPYYNGVVICEADLLPKPVANDETALHFIDHYGGATIHLCRLTGWWCIGAPPWAIITE